MHNLHQIVEDELEAPALAWNILAWYWGMSAFGLGPAYIAYTQTEADKQDEAFNDESNIELNTISGLTRPITIRERFHRAANYYIYCYEQGRRTAINHPYDAPPTIQGMLELRYRMEAKTPPPDQMIESTAGSVLASRPDLHKLWSTGGEMRRQQRARDYHSQILDSLQYIASEMTSLSNVVPDQLSETGFLIEDLRGNRYNITAAMMDEAMPPDVQERKFGECYLQRTPTEDSLVLSGIFGAYYTMGHNLEMAMYDEERKKDLASIHHAIIYTWRQLHEIYEEMNT